MSYDQERMFDNLISSSKNYISREYLPREITIREISHTKESQYYRNKCIKMVYVKSGSGYLVVNEEKYCAEKGFCALFNYFHYFKVQPGTNQCLELYYFLIPHSSLQFMKLSPYARLFFDEFSEEFLSGLFTDQEQEELQVILGAILENWKKHNIYLQNIYLYELITCLNRKCGQELPGQ